jgi:hypothetical protein
MESCLKIGGGYQHWLGALLYKIGIISTLSRATTQNTTTTHNYQHELPPPYPSAALALSLHNNIRHGPKSWRRYSLWAHTRLAASVALSLLLVTSFGAPKRNPSKNRERGGVSALGGRRLNIQSNNQPKVRNHGGGDIWEGARPGQNVWG